jgi:hypothetical protein
LAFGALAALGPSLALGDDNQIAQTIVERLQAQKQAGTLKGFSLDLQVEEGTVWLTGRVSTPDQQALALDIARRVPGVRQVVNDINVDAVARAAHPQTQSPASRGLFASLKSKVQRAVGQGEQGGVEPAAVGTGVEGGGGYFEGAPAAPAPIPAPQVAGPLPPQMASRLPQAQPIYPQPQMYPQPQFYQRSNLPMAYAPAHSIAYQGGNGAGPGAALGAGPGDPLNGGVAGTPVPMHMGGGIGMAPARYDHPHMPGYAWPSYASYPNYAAVTYPKMYSPTAWPYIGPFYPYPQVPLGWRKVTLEWDDGWWMLDFKDRRR